MCCPRRHGDKAAGIECSCLGIVSFFAHAQPACT
jgi:hypothetical protein